MIGIGASVAANCQPCLRNAIGLAHENGVTDEEICEAVGVAKMVRKGALSGIDVFTSSLIKDVKNLSDSEKGCGCRE